MVWLLYPAKCHAHQATMEDLKPLWPGGQSHNNLYVARQQWFFKLSFFFLGRACCRVTLPSDHICEVHAYEEPCDYPVHHSSGGWR